MVFPCGMVMLGSRPSRDAFEEKAVLLSAQPASEAHALARERKHGVSDLNLPADLLAQPGCHDGAALGFLHVEHAAQAHGAVLVQATNFGLTQQLVVGLGFLGRNVQFAERRLEYPMAGEIEQVTETPLASIVMIGH